ncbi:isoaspartyl peptidase/L-asparaginase family protein [Caulobacter sp. NIBR2454]|uniref:isoaspartyl peptidase/L-asparaginase family protein n=1 Tax=Caulobacter sp. NIBR2454 TaxID=3015996 RepID=UPI0022B60CC3|nr:isoaspartyl peptidase/L-asparaginase [Caulobacter sp. NIBR2454]
MSNKCLSLALHGGAGAKPGRNYDREIAHMKGLVEQARDALRAGATALDVATSTTVALEASGLYVAGRGASPNLAGEYELDACIMDGLSGKAGAVAALQGFKSPITAARAVMDRTPHVMLAGSGAARFAAEQALEAIDDPKAWFTHAGQFEANHAPGALAHGTVGCVVRDGEGRLAAATSTAGVFNKMPGRVGDSPIPAAGAWADAHVAVSCTGQGEYFIRLAAAAQIGFRMRFAGQSLEEATKAVIAELAALGGDGGLIAVSADGSVSTPFHSQGMKRATLSGDGTISAAAF